MSRAIIIKAFVYVAAYAFPDMNSFRAENFNQGWTYFAADALPRFLAKG